jgi:quercetin dioxygenase-like cupin family protein
MQLFQNAMAYKNKTICNPVTGQNITFLQTATDTGGALLEMESVYNSTSKEPAPHYHPAQEEDFTVLEGSLSVKLNGTAPDLTCRRYAAHFKKRSTCHVESYRWQNGG